MLQIVAIAQGHDLVLQQLQLLNVLWSMINRCAGAVNAVSRAGKGICKKSR